MTPDLGDGHGDVEELPPAALGNGAREEELQAVFRKQRLLILKRKERFSTSVSEKTAIKRQLKHKKEQ